MEQPVIVVRGRLARRIREEAEKLGASIDEYLVELLSQGLDPRDRAVEYIEAAENLLEEAREELRNGNVRQAAEKTWGVAALAIKAYAYWREGKRLTSHGELWRYIDIMAKEVGDWVRDAFHAGHAMHTCFYEGWCTDEGVKASLNRVEKLVREVENIVKRGVKPDDSP